MLKQDLVQKVEELGGMWKTDKDIDEVDCQNKQGKSHQDPDPVPKDSARGKT
jgi:hypothetical protein